MNTEQWQMLLDAFGDAANHTYQAAAQQTQLNTIYGVVITIALLALGAFLVATFKRIKPKVHEIDKEIFYLFSGLTAALYLAICVPLVAYYVTSILNYILNPDWAILQTLSTLIQ